LPDTVTDAIDKWVDSGPVDFIIVIGTSLSTFPAAEYIEEARGESTRLAVINIDRDEEPHEGMRQGDWFFLGDAAVVVPEILKGATQSTFTTPPDPLTASDNDLVSNCHDKVSRVILSGLNYGNTIVKVGGRAVIKFGSGVTENEAKNQRMAYSQVDPKIVRVPAVHRFIRSGDNGYLVMEYLEGISNPTEIITDDRVRKLVDAIAHFGQLNCTRIGPLGGGPVRGQLWTDDLIFTPTTIDSV
jgi:hypothetical protein